MGTSNYGAEFKRDAVHQVTAPCDLAETTSIRT